MARRFDHNSLLRTRCWTRRAWLALCAMLSLTLAVNAQPLTSHRPGVCLPEAFPLRRNVVPDVRWSLPTPNTVRNADLALFTVGLNHADYRRPNGSDHPVARDIRNVAASIRNVAPDGRRVIVAISETGGCDDCGSPVTMFPGGAAHVLADELARRYGLRFNVRRAIPRLPTDSSSVPALVYGEAWSQETPANFIGVTYPFPLTSHHDRYAYTRLTNGAMTLAFYVVHLATDEPFDRQSQMNFLVNEAQHQTGVVSSFILGDFNINSAGYARFLSGSQGDDARWLAATRGSADWMSLAQTCVYARGTADRGHATFFGNKLGLTQFGPPSPVARSQLVPIAYAFDPNETGAPRETSEPLHFEGIAHGGLGVFYQLQRQPPVPVTCTAPLVRCAAACVSLGTNTNCGACGDACVDGRACRDGACRCAPGTLACGAQCVSPDTNEHCGSCFACPASTTCQNRECVCANRSQRNCGGGCRSVASDRANCGACGNACPLGAACRSGRCTCPAGQDVCPSSPPRCLPPATCQHVVEVGRNRGPRQSP